jgi:hypothetical protein
LPLRERARHVLALRHGDEEHEHREHHERCDTARLERHEPAAKAEPELVQCGQDAVYHRRRYYFSSRRRDSRP